jgi:hypothetical protein
MTSITQTQSLARSKTNDNDNGTNTKRSSPTRHATHDDSDDDAVGSDAVGCEQ